MVQIQHTHVSSNIWHELVREGAELWVFDQALLSYDLVLVYHLGKGERGVTFGRWAFEENQ